MDSSACSTFATHAQHEDYDGCVHVHYTTSSTESTYQQENTGKFAKHFASNFCPKNFFAALSDLVKID